MKLNNTCTKDNTPLFRNHQKTNPQLFLNTTWMLLVFLFSFSGITSQLYAADKNGTAKPTYQAFAGNEYYVSPSGTPGGDGSINNPWDLQTALNHPAVIQPGSTIWLKPGTYKGTFISKLTGTASSPILVKAMPGGRAIIDGSRAGQLVKNVNTLQLSGAYTWYSGFEVTNSDPSRVISQSGSNPQERRGEGVYVLGAGIKVINLIIYDTGEGLSCWSSAENNEYYGNVIFNNGWFAPDREHGHGIYAQNNTGTKSYVDNIVLNNFSYGWQFY